MKKVLITMMCVVMVIAMMPAMAFADEVAAGETVEAPQTEADANAGADTSVTEKVATAEVEDGVQTYGSLEAAVKAVKAGGTVTLLQNASGDGIGTFRGADPNGDKITAKSMTIDLRGFTYTISANPVGSTGYESQGFHLEWSGDFDNNYKVTIKNGKITSTADSGAPILIQNYCDLTLHDVELDGSNLGTGNYVLSNNCGKVNLTGNTSIKAPENGVAFDVYGGFQSYPNVNVTVNTTGKIVGKIEVAKDEANVGEETYLKIENGIFENSEISRTEQAVDAEVTVLGGTFDSLDALEYTDNTSDINIVLGKDYTDLSEAVTIKGTVTLDLNGHSITTKEESAVAVLQGATLTVKDSSAEKSGKIIGGAVGIKMGISDENDKEANSKLVVEGGTISGGNYGISGNGLRHGTEITVTGGTITGTNGTGIFHPQKGTLTVNGGTITGPTGIEIRSGNLIVTGGTIKGTADETKVESNKSGATTTGAGIAIAPHVTKNPVDVTVTGGTVEGHTALNHANPEKLETEDVDITIKGGTFTGDENGKAINSTKEDFVLGGKFEPQVDDKYLASGVVQDSNGNVSRPSFGGGTIVSSLEKAKTEAAKALDEYAKLDDYEAAEQAEIKAIVEKAKAEIKKAATEEEVKKLEAEAKAEIDLIKTAAEKAAEKKIAACKETKLIARSQAVKTKSGKKAIKITWKAKEGSLESLDGVQIFRSTKKADGTYKKVFTSKSGKYINTSVKKGQMYYYKVRGYVRVDGKLYFTKYSTKAWRRV